MNEFTKEKLLSFILQIESLKSSLQNDVYGTPIIKIKNFKKEGNNIYKVNGVAEMDLSFIGKEQTFFEVEIVVELNRLILKNSQVSKFKRSAKSIYRGSEKFDFVGAKLETVDSFAIRKHNMKKYLVHLTGSGDAIVYPVNKNYLLRDGFDESIESLSFDEFSELEKEKKEKLYRTKLRSLIRRR